MRKIERIKVILATSIKSMQRTAKYKAREQKSMLVGESFRMKMHSMRRPSDVPNGYNSRAAHRKSMLISSANVYNHSVSNDFEDSQMKQFQEYQEDMMAGESVNKSKKKSLWNLLMSRQKYGQFKNGIKYNIAV